MQKIISAMLHALKSAGAESAVVKDYNSLVIDVSQVDCDYYRFEKQDAATVSAYSGEFMAQYP